MPRQKSLGFPPVYGRGVNDTPFTGSSRDSPLLGPGPNPSEQPAIQAGAAEVMQKTGDLITFNYRGRMSETLRNSRAHPRGADSMRPVVSPNYPHAPARIGHVIESKELSGERSWNEQGSPPNQDVCHK